MEKQIKQTDWTGMTGNVKVVYGNRSWIMNEKVAEVFNPAACLDREKKFESEYRKENKGRWAQAW